MDAPTSQLSHRTIGKGTCGKSIILGSGFGSGGGPELPIWGEFNK